MNKPRVDWEKILRDLRDSDKLGRKATDFVVQQLIKNDVANLTKWWEIHESNQAGHKVKRKRYSYRVPTDLDCDDPYYDGVPVIDI